MFWHEDCNNYSLQALDMFWHEDCLKCGCCDCRLGEVGHTLYTKGNLLLCKRDYLRLFGSTGYCAACNKVTVYRLLYQSTATVLLQLCCLQYGNTLQTYQIKHCNSFTTTAICNKVEYYRLHCQSNAIGLLLLCFLQ